MDELNPEARTLVDEARAELSPSAADHQRIKRAVQAAIVVGGTGAATSASATAVGMKWILGAVVVTAAAVGTATLTLSDGPLVQEPAPAATETTPDVPPPSEPPVDSTEAPLPPPVATGPLESPAAGIENALAPGRRQRRRPSLSAPKETKAPIGASLAAEAALLREAREARRAGEPRRTLELLRQHRDRFPASQLRDERLVIEVQTRCDLGQKKQAKAIAAELLMRNPRSPAAPVIAASCAGTE